MHRGARQAFIITTTSRLPCLVSLFFCSLFLLADGAADGIWYHKIPVHTPVWVANHETPVSNTSRLAITPDGNLALFDASGFIV